MWVGEPRLWGVCVRFVWAQGNKYAWRTHAHKSLWGCVILGAGMCDCYTCSYIRFVVSSDDWGVAIQYWWKFANRFGNLTWRPLQVVYEVPVEPHNDRFSFGFMTSLWFGIIIRWGSICVLVACLFERFRRFPLDEGSFKSVEAHFYFFAIKQNSECFISSISTLK